MEFHRIVPTLFLLLLLGSPASAKLKAENLRCFQALGKFEFAEGSEHHGKFIAVARFPGGLKEYVWDGRAMSLLVRGRGVQPNPSLPKDVFWSTDQLANGGDGRVFLKTKGMQLSLNDIAYMQLQLIRESFNRFRESEPDPRRTTAYREMLIACRDVKDMMIDHKTIGTLANEQLQRLEVPVEAGRRNGQSQGTKP